MKISIPTALTYVHALLAGLYLIFVVVGPWAKLEDDGRAGVFAADGGSGFGLMALLLALALAGLAGLRLMGRRQLLPGLGVEQLTVILGFAAWMNIVAYIVGWRASFPAGTGWTVVAAYFPASIIPQIGMLTLSIAEPDTSVSTIDAGRRRVFSIAAALAGAGVALFPFLTWLSTDGTGLSAFDERSGNPISGPRFGYILLVMGVVVFVAAFMRMRPQGLAEPGPNALLSHALIGTGAVAVVIPISTLISIVRFPTDLGTGIGLWLGLIAGLAMVVVGFVETSARGARGT